MSGGEAALRTGRETLAGVRERTEVSRGQVAGPGPGAPGGAGPAPCADGD